MLQSITKVVLDDTPKPKEDDTANAVPDTDDIPDQEVENQTKFVRALQTEGVTRGLVAFGCAAGYLTSTSIAVGYSIEAFNHASGEAILRDAQESLASTAKEHMFKVVARTKERISETLSTLNTWLKESIHYVAENPKKVAAAVAIFGGMLVLGTKFRSALTAIKSEQAATMAPEDRVAPIKVLFDRMKSDAETRLFKVTDRIDAQVGSNFKETMGYKEKEIQVDVFQYDAESGTVKLTSTTTATPVATTPETLTLRQKASKVFEMFGRLLEYAAEVQFAINDKISSYYRGHMQMVNGVSRDEDGSYTFSRPTGSSVGTGLMGLVKYTGVFALIYSMINFIKGVYRWATRPAPKASEKGEPAHV